LGVQRKKHEAMVGTLRKMQQRNNKNIKKKIAAKNSPQGARSMCLSSLKGENECIKRTGESCQFTKSRNHRPEPSSGFARAQEKGGESDTVYSSPMKSPIGSKHSLIGNEDKKKHSFGEGKKQSMAIAQGREKGGGGQSESQGV